MMKSIRIKLVTLYLALVFVVMIASGTFMLTQVRQQETETARDALISYARMLDEAVLRSLSPEASGDTGLSSEPEKLQHGMRTVLTENPLMHGYILNLQGRTVASTRHGDGLGFPVGDGLSQPLHFPVFSDLAVISAADGEPHFTTSRDIDEEGLYKEWFNFAVLAATQGEGGEPYIIFTRMEAEPMNELLWRIAAILLQFALLALLLTGILGFLFASTITTPIANLTKRAKEMAHGQLSQHIPVHSSDEIGQLTESFNFMSDAINRYMGSMVSEKNKLEAILHNMTDGILAYDSEGTLLHANTAAADLLNFDDLAATPFAEVMETLDTPFRSVKDVTPDLLGESTINRGDKFISVTFTSYTDKADKTNGLVVVLQDITRLRKLDDMRKEFVANVSHEIRTPLTTIKGYTETLLDGAMEDKPLAREFLGVIESETDRMTLLTQDLLELSRFDNRQMDLSFEKVNLIAILNQCITQNSLLARQKGQTITFNDDGAVFWMMGDAARINQVFTNIIHNAVKYSNEGAAIIVAAEETDKYYRIYIRDNGVGIPKENLSRIFERFYRVDKARSRAMGGTGLGLAIAKEIMEAHDGKIFAASVQGKGTTMTLRFTKTVPEV